MAERRTAVWRPSTLFTVHHTIVVVVSFAVAVWAFWVNPWAAQEAVRGEVKSSELLATLVGISGITIPLVIAYLSLGRREFSRLVHERTMFFLRLNQITLEGCRDAYIQKADRSQPPSKALKVVAECLGLTAPSASGDQFSNESREWMFPGDKERSAYEQYFESENDRQVGQWAIASIGAAAIASFGLIFLRFMQPHLSTSQNLATLEVFIIAYTFLMNVWAYYYLIRLVRLRDVVRRQALNAIKNACDSIRPEVAQAVGAARVLTDELRHGLTQTDE